MGKTPASSPAIRKAMLRRIQWGRLLRDSGRDSRQEETA
jgi:hypothetical protein